MGLTLDLPKPDILVRIPADNILQYLQTRVNLREDLEKDEQDLYDHFNKTDSNREIGYYALKLDILLFFSSDDLCISLDFNYLKLIVDDFSDAHVKSVNQVKMQPGAENDYYTIEGSYTLIPEHSYIELYQNQARINLLLQDTMSMRVTPKLSTSTTHTSATTLTTSRKRKGSTDNINIEQSPPEKRTRWDSYWDPQQPTDKIAETSHYNFRPRPARSTSQPASEATHAAVNKRSASTPALLIQKAEAVTPVIPFNQML